MSKNKKATRTLYSLYAKSQIFQTPLKMERNPQIDLRMNVVLRGKCCDRKDYFLGPISALINGVNLKHANCSGQGLWKTVLYIARLCRIKGFLGNNIHLVLHHNAYW